MPKLTRLDQARRRPARTVLTAIVHSLDRYTNQLLLAMKVAFELEEDRKTRYLSYLLSAPSPRWGREGVVARAPPDRQRVGLFGRPSDLSQEQRELVLGGFTMEQRSELTKLELDSVAYHDGLQKGRREGHREGLVKLLLTIFELRGLELAPETQARVHACADLEQLETRIERAKRAHEPANVFES